MTSIPKLRSDAKMPSDEAFSKAVAWSVSNVLFQYASKLELPKNKTVAMAAKEIGDGLSWAYSCSPVRDVPAAWRKLIQSLQVISTAKVEFQLLKITASSVEGFDVDNSVKRRLQELEKIVCAQTKDAIRFAQNYLHAIQQVAIDEDEWSEKSSAQYPVLPIPSEMSKVDAALMSQLNAFINELASH